MACRTDRVSSNRLPKTRPSSSRVVFCIGTKQGIAARGAEVNPLLVRVPISVGERQFRSPSAKYVILAARQDVFPLIVRELHFLIQRNGGELGANLRRPCFIRFGSSARKDRKAREKKCEKNCNLKHRKKRHYGRSNRRLPADCPWRNEFAAPQNKWFRTL